jgi:hypothetical protein
LFPFLTASDVGIKSTRGIVVKKSAAAPDDFYTQEAKYYLREVYKEANH